MDGRKAPRKKEADVVIIRSSKQLRGGSPFKTSIKPCRQREERKVQTSWEANRSSGEKRKRKEPDKWLPDEELQLIRALHEFARTDLKEVRNRMGNTHRNTNQINMKLNSLTLRYERQLRLECKPEKGIGIVRSSLEKKR